MNEDSDYDSVVPSRDSLSSGDEFFTVHAFINVLSCNNHNNNNVNNKVLKINNNIIY